VLDALHQELERRDDPFTIRTFPITGDDGIQRGFEVENIYFPMSGALRRMVSSSQASRA